MKEMLSGISSILINNVHPRLPSGNVFFRIQFTTKMKLQSLKIRGKDKEKETKKTSGPHVSVVIELFHKK